MPIDSREARPIAGIELNALLIAGVISAKVDGAEVSAQVTPIHDVNSEVLFYRLPVLRRQEQLAVVDVAAHEVLGDPLLAVSTGMIWNPDALIGEAREYAQRRDIPVEKADEVRFVAFSYPKIAVQFLAGREEIAMLELFTWEPVPPAGRGGDDRKPLEPGSFERWSVIDEMPADIRDERARRFEERLARLREYFDRDPWVIERSRWIKDFVLKIVDTRELAYSRRQGDHADCYELRGQETNVWCVGASAQMLLDFYRYEYTQTRLAQELGLGTPANPNGLPYSQVAHVVTALEALTSNGLDATMITNPAFSLFRNEIRQNRPLISFVPGHSRTVAGYTEHLIAPINSDPYRGLLVFDPWPPNSGVITRWENFATQIYQYAYTARVGTI